MEVLRTTGRAVVAGSHHRRRETVGDLDILVATTNGKAVGNKLVGCENVAEVLSHGATRTTVVLRSGLQVDVRAVPARKLRRRPALFHRVHGAQHRFAQRRRASVKLNEYGLFSGKRRIGGSTENEIYKKLGLAFIPPELREDRGEITLAAAHKLPDLIEKADIRGDLHVHSDWTDGTASIEAMAMAAQAHGYEYIALTDHSRRVAMAHGLDPSRLKRQGQEIDKLNERLGGLTILKGIEVDILKDGQLDLPDAILANLDVVVASVPTVLRPAARRADRAFDRHRETRMYRLLGIPPAD